MYCGKGSRKISYQSLMEYFTLDWRRKGKAKNWQNDNERGVEDLQHGAMANLGVSHSPRPSICFLFVLYYLYFDAIHAFFECILLLGIVP